MISSNDVDGFKREMASTVEKSKLSLIKKRASRGGGTGTTSSTANSCNKKQGLSTTHHPSSKSVGEVSLREHQVSLPCNYPDPPVRHSGLDSVACPPAAPPKSTSQEILIHCSSRAPTQATQPSVKTTGIGSSSNTTTCTSDIKNLAGKVSDVQRPSGAVDSTSDLRVSVQWQCQECTAQGDGQGGCIPVRTESRCLCGHRYKEHKVVLPGPGVPVTPDSVRLQCASRSCPCRHFFFIAAEGAWVLRCRCKHKHTDHDCSKGGGFRCKKQGCSCNGFDSPWVCNCGHSWSSHQQRVTERLRPTGLIAEALAMHRQQAQTGAPTQVHTATHTAELEDMVGLLTDPSALRDMDVDITTRRDGNSGP